MTERIDLPRRNFIGKAVYVAPVIVTLAVAPSYAKAGSVKDPTTSPLDPITGLVRNLLGG